MARCVDAFGDAAKGFPAHPDREVAAHWGKTGSPVGQNIPRGLMKSLVQICQKSSQSLNAGDSTPGCLSEGDGAFSKLLGKVGEFLEKIESKAQQSQRGLFGTGQGFDQNSCHLTVFQQKVVGPFQTRLKIC